jgi:type III pantothenate kinase
MVLTVNVGNSHAHFGVFRGGRLQRAFDLPTPPPVPQDAWRHRLARALGIWGKYGAWEGVLAATVVPSVRHGLDDLLQALTRKKVRWVTALTPMPVKNGYRPPKSLGVDRLLNAVGACEEFGAPLIIVDAGTAITVDAVDQHGTFLGGAIFPGLAVSGKCLAQSTALLPRVVLKKPASLLGRSTQAGLQAGLVAGTAGAIAALVAGLRRKVGARAVVVGTGGGLANRTLAIPSIRCLRRPHAALQGLYRLWQDGRTLGQKRRAR